MPLLLPRLQGCSCLLGHLVFISPFPGGAASWHLILDPESSLRDRHRKAGAWGRVNPCASLGCRLRCLHVPWCCDQQQHFSLGLSGSVPCLPETVSPISTRHLLRALVDLLLDS